MKTYLPNETKEQRKLRKLRERGQLPAIQNTPPNDNKIDPYNFCVDNPDKKYLVCLKHGAKYGPEYVNKLYNMTKRNSTIDFEFVCFTENPSGINENITIKPLPVITNINGWWYKPMFFNPKLGLNGTILFMDLDLIVFRNIDRLWTYKTGQFIILQDFNRYAVKNYTKFNSSVFRLTTGQHSNVYNEFIKNPSVNSRRFHGDQDWIRFQIKNGYEFWPNDWIQSYKWEMRNKPQMTRDPKGHRNFTTPGDPVIKKDTAIAVFHGDPNPHNCIDPWCAQNWY